MNKTAIRNFAIWARNKLIADVKYGSEDYKFDYWYGLYSARAS